MLDDPKNIFGIAAGLVGTTIYYFSIRNKDKSRVSKAGGLVCPRCREHFSPEQLFKLDSVLTFPFKLLGWNTKIMSSVSQKSNEDELDGLYCANCLSTLNFVIFCGYLLIGLPLIGSVLYVALDFLFDLNG